MRNVRTEAQAELLSLYRQLHKLDDMRAEVLREIKTSERTPPSSVHPEVSALKAGSPVKPTQSERQPKGEEMTMAQCQNTTRDGKVRCQGAAGHQGLHFFGGVALADFDTANSARHEEALRPALVRALEDVKRGNDNIEKLMALVAIQQADLTLAHDALATAHEDVLTVVRGGTRDLGKTANGLDVAMQALVISHATRGERLASVTPEKTKT